MEHRLSWFGKGADLCGRCSCEWAWIGEIEINAHKHRRQKCLTAFEKHLDRVAWAARMNEGLAA
jgi:hypothetical protein